MDHLLYHAPFWIEAKTRCFHVFLNANELRLPAPFPEEGCTFTFHALDTTARTDQEKKYDRHRKYWCSALCV